MSEINRITDHDEQVSALVDGCLCGSALAACVQRVESDAEAQSQWHVYHLIGDVLRSEELARHAHGHAAFMARLQDRLQAEGAIDHVAPYADPTRTTAPFDIKTPAANDGLFRWKMVAGLASVAAMAAVGWNLWAGGMAAPAQGQLAAREPAAPTLVQAAPGPTPTSTAATPVRMISSVAPKPTVLPTTTGM